MPKKRFTCRSAARRIDRIQLPLDWSLRHPTGAETTRGSQRAPALGLSEDGCSHRGRGQKPEASHYGFTFGAGNGLGAETALAALPMYLPGFALKAPRQLVQHR